MIPYFNGHLGDLSLPGIGKVAIHMFGVLVALGVIVGDRVVVAQGRRRGLEPDDVKYMNARIVIGGFIVAHLVSVIFYFPERLHEDWRVLFNPFAGLSSFGGFLGAFLAFLYYTKKADIPRLPYADSVALGLSIGWIFGRTGCFTAHDHPGRHVGASFFLSVNYPDGPRIDLGLYELLFTIVMTVILFRYNRKPRPPGRIIALAMLLYAPARFILDFLRETAVSAAISHPDKRFLALTPAQWACLATIALGVYIWQRPAPVPPAPPAPPSDAPAPSDTPAAAVAPEGQS
jgi:phosphatidylglycerol---prolipoprotein diacylglyceryl transferase